MFIWLSKPHMGGSEESFVAKAFESNFIAPVGPQLNEFEAALEKYIGHGVHCVCVSSGTAALHLALHMENLEAGNEVWLSSMTFAGGAFPVNYVNATPVFFDLDPVSRTLSADLIEESLTKRAKINRLLKVIVATDLYGQTCDYDRLEELSDRFGVTLIIDAAESMGAKYRGQAAGYAGKASIVSFNGNKIMTTGGGGAFVTKDKDLADKARFLSTQAREPVPHYEHREFGFNYRMGNVPAAIGLGQLECLDIHVKLRKTIFARYLEELDECKNIEFSRETDWCDHSRWLTTAFVDIDNTQCGIADTCKQFVDAGIETRRFWKPMHLQPLYAGAKYIGEGVDEKMFECGICLPSSSNMTSTEQSAVIAKARELVDCAYK